MSDYPYDPHVLDEVARRLYDAVPAMYRVPDGPPAGSGDLKSLLDVLAAPLAVLRQSIEELHADLFIDTADDRMLPYLAEMVGTALVFPDAPSNRRDVRGTVGWRRRKGTPGALEEMADELTGLSVVMQEGWKRIQLAQDLDLLRPERVAVDVRPAIVAEQAAGPLDALHHSVDVRSITATTGRLHPRHVAHWLQPTTTFPLREATASERTLPGSDVRYAIDPLGVRQPLRARRIAGDREPFVDRIQEQHFAAAPQRWFGAPGGFTIRACGLPAGIAATDAADRVPSDRVASAQLGGGDVVLTVLEQPSRGWRGAVRIELGLAEIAPAGATWQPDPATFAPRAGVDLDAGGVVGTASAGGAAPGGERVAVLRLRALGGALGRFFPGATLEIASAAVGSATAVDDSELAREGFLRGALHVRLPALELDGDRLLLVAADGSVYEAHDRAGALVDMPTVDGDRRLAAGALLAAGPGAAWPPLAPRSEPRMLDRVPAAPGRGPAVMHGARPLLRASGGGFAELPPGAGCALSFAVQLEQPGSPAFGPFQRLEWTGGDPRAATWTALDRAGAAVGAGAVAARYAEIADERERDSDRVALAVRFECTIADATLCPGEVAWSADDGRTILVHLPQLDAGEQLAAAASWPAAPPLAFASEAVRVAEDGSTWASESTAGRRASHGDIAPIAEAAALRRRRVRWRRLCAWDREDRTASPPQTLALTRRGRLDVDVLHGLFAFAAEEPPQPWPAGPGPAPGTPPPPNVTTDYEEGATMHLGARPAAREPVLDLPLARPTRLVTRGGTLHPDAPATWHAIPRYPSLTLALEAVSARWQALTAQEVAAGADAEVVQFEDSATYPAEGPVWPRGPSDATARDGARLALTIQAAERERPTILVDPGTGWRRSSVATPYAAITLRGIAFGGAGWHGMTLPAADHVALELCTVLEADNALTFGDPPAGAHVTITLCETAGLELTGAGTLTIADSIVEARPREALLAPAGDVVLDRASVGGEVRVRAIEASEVIFDGLVTVEDRFNGCVRYSRVADGSTLPRIHRSTIGTAVRVVSRNRRHPAWWRLREDCPRAITRGAESGSEMGAFGDLHFAERIAGFERRLAEFTPAGLVTGIIRID